MEHLRRLGHGVTALVRPQSRPLLDRLERAGAHVVEGDVLDGSADAWDAMAGHDVVASSLGFKRESVRNPWSKLTSPPELNSRTARLIVAAMNKHGVKRVIAVSAAGVGDSAARMNWLMRFLVAKSNIGVAYRDLAVMEDVFRQSGLEWLCPRPTRLTSSLTSRPTRVIDSFPSSAAISRLDVALWMIERMAGESWGEQFPTRTPIITS